MLLPPSTTSRNISPRRARCSLSTKVRATSFQEVRFCSIGSFLVVAVSFKESESLGNRHTLCFNPISSWQLGIKHCSRQKSDTLWTVHFNGYHFANFAMQSCFKQPGFFPTLLLDCHIIALFPSAGMCICSGWEVAGICWPFKQVRLPLTGQASDLALRYDAPSSLIGLSPAHVCHLSSGESPRCCGSEEEVTKATQPATGSQLVPAHNRERVAPKLVHRCSRSAPPVPSWRRAQRDSPSHPHSSG